MGSAARSLAKVKVAPALVFTELTRTNKASSTAEFMPRAAAGRTALPSDLDAFWVIVTTCVLVASAPSLSNVTRLLAEVFFDDECTEKAFPDPNASALISSSVPSDCAFPSTLKSLPPVLDILQVFDSPCSLVRDGLMGAPLNVVKDKSA